MRRPFAGTASTVLVTQTGLNGGATVTVWNSSVGGSQLTDLQTLDGVPITSGVLTADNNGIVPQFLGPDDGTDSVYLDAGLGRLLVQSNDWTDRARAIELAEADLVARITKVENGGGGTTTGGGGAPSTSGALDGGGA